ncbi:MAG: 30S ribosomal protein S2 [Planctomycetota bacterium]|nr:30S ribosomal protein S2 [Planctomycetota bacterium]
MIRSRLRRLEELEKMEESGTIEIESKKMASTLRREKKKIDRNLGGIREMSQIPGAMVVIDPAREINAIKEARRLGVPVVGILDTDCDPSVVDIVIPGNDDALKSVRLLVDRLATAVEEGSANRREQVAAAGGDRSSDTPVGDEPRPTRNQRAQDLRARRGPSAEAAPAAPAAEATPEAGA